LEVPELTAWCHEIEARVAGLSRIGIRPVDRQARSKLVRGGFVGVLPLWRRAGVTVGLQAMPGQAPEAWPGVIEKGDQALTLAADASTLLPRFLFTRLLSNNIEGAESLAGKWPEVRDEATALHDLLGGAPEILATVVGVITDPETRKPFEYDVDRPAPFEAAHSRLARKIDRSPAFARYADWIDASLTGNAAPPHPPEAYGVWVRQLYCRAAEFPRDRLGGAMLPQAILLDLAEAFAGLDTAVPNVPGWELRPGASSGAAALVSIANKIDLDACADDPIRRGLVEALRTEHMNYRGLAHAEAVVALDEGGEPERAWGALHSAAWWGARSTGEAPAAILDGARLLCDRHGWDHIRWVVDRAAETGGTA
jgi:hypothetical protein